MHSVFYSIFNVSRTAYAFLGFIKVFFEILKMGGIEIFRIDSFLINFFPSNIIFKKYIETNENKIFAFILQVIFNSNFNSNNSHLASNQKYSNDWLFMTILMDHCILFERFM